MSEFRHGHPLLGKSPRPRLRRPAARSATPLPGAAVKVTDPKAAYPHVDGVEDWRAAQSLRLVWDRLFDLEGRLQGIEPRVGDLASRLDQVNTHLTTVEHKADEALAEAQLTRTETQTIGDEAGPLPGGGDGGEGAAGCADHYATGHPGATVDQTAREAGKIICGVGVEFSTLLAIAADQDTRTANAIELVERMIWHLQQAGFTAGRQKNPSGLISTNKLAVICDGIPRAYDVLTNASNYTVAMTTSMQEVGSPNLQATSGTAD